MNKQDWSIALFVTLVALMVVWVMALLYVMTYTHRTAQLINQTKGGVVATYPDATLPLQGSSIYLQGGNYAGMQQTEL